MLDKIRFLKCVYRREISGIVCSSA